MSYEDLITPKMVDDALHHVARQEPPPRPIGGVPCVGRTAKGKIIWLKPMTLKQWESLEITSVTGYCKDGWTTWHPVERGDAARFATRKCGKAAKKKLLKESEVIPDDYHGRRR